MKIIDLTRTIHSEMPLFPGSDPPQIIQYAAVETDGYLEHNIIIPTHIGTHIDAPAHMIADGKTLDKFNADQFIGKACKINISGPDNESVSVEALKPFETRIRNSEFVLLYSGWENRWGDASYFSGYPVLTPEAALWLANFNLKGIGFDMISPDPVDSTDFPIHKVLLTRNIVIIENLKALATLPDDNFIFSCLPLKIRNADGSPVRAVAILDKV